MNILIPCKLNDISQVCPPGSSEPSLDSFSNFLLHSGEEADTPGPCEPAVSTFRISTFGMLGLLSEKCLSPLITERIFKQKFCL